MRAGDGDLLLLVRPAKPPVTTALCALGALARRWPQQWLRPGPSAAARLPRRARRAAAAAASSAVGAAEAVLPAETAA